MLLGDADAVVLDLDAQVLALVDDAHRDRTALARELDCVADDDHDDHDMMVAIVSIPEGLTWYLTGRKEYLTRLKRICFMRSGSPMRTG